MVIACYKVLALLLKSVIDSNTLISMAVDLELISNIANPGCHCLCGIMSRFTGCHKANNRLQCFL